MCFVRSGKSKPNKYDEDIKGEVYFSIKEAIESGIQAAILCSPASLHVPQAIEFVKAKIPVLIEKPLSLNMASTNYLKLLSQNLSVPVLVGYCFRHCDSLNKLVSLYSDNHAGESFMLELNAVPTFLIGGLLRILKIQFLLTPLWVVEYSGIKP